MERTPEAVIKSHLALRKAGDVEGDIRENYAPDVVIIDRERTYEGHGGVRESAASLAESVPDGVFSYERVVVSKDMGYLLWTAEGTGVSVDVGVDSFVVRDGKISAQTIFYRAVQPATSLEEK